MNRITPKFSGLNISHFDSGITIVRLTESKEKAKTLESFLKDKDEKAREYGLDTLSKEELDEYNLEDRLRRKAEECAMDADEVRLNGKRLGTSKLVGVLSRMLSKKISLPDGGVQLHHEGSELRKMLKFVIENDIDTSSASTQSVLEWAGMTVKERFAEVKSAILKGLADAEYIEEIASRGDDEVISQEFFN